MRAIIIAAALIAGTNAFGTCDDDEEKKWKRVAKTSQKVRRAQDYEVRRTGRKFGLVRKKKTSLTCAIKKKTMMTTKHTRVDITD